MFQCEQQWPLRGPGLPWAGKEHHACGGWAELGLLQTAKVALQHQVMDLGRVFTLQSTWRTCSLGPGLARSLHLISIFFLPWSWPLASGKLFF